ncbi:MAG: sigma-70 family RNA polymerase sigma factor [Symploca sp. SIO3C6]|uniref:Sigma-70 family RNA polymerase sigma factor n=1 Tax=Symploca sp. SIO1C4 TaxID=2607765 RepID=A0A6B3NML8_9CYAN|nr:sigma-70 family RNA polymerase sigma factor [Symploca sp. SIO3C6]NER31474.1 sigma-70 family RNA polymerase sigma factor [Symploca sp. SIO1C4]NET04661.1 sigma-70 family RNA polymerase sigma factor [Symploca sp. SIO2B6]
MNQQEERLRQLVEQACSHRPGSAERQKNLTKIIRLVTGKLWKENTPYYQDALQQTWIYFCQNLCEGKTGKAYDYTRGSIATWLNFYLKRRLQDFRIEEQRRQAKQATQQLYTSSSSQTTQNLDPVENLAAQPDIPPLLEEVKAWIETDPHGELRQTHITNRRDVTCQVLLKRRLPPEASWKTLAEEFKLPISTLSSFYQRQCLPRLRKFGQSEGYL